MHKVDSFGATAQNEFTNGNPVAGVPRTRFEAKWPTTVQRELCGVVEQAGITLSDADDAQLRASVMLHVRTFAALRLLPIPAQPVGRKIRVFLESASADDDTGDGIFRWESASAAADDSDTVIRPASNPATGRWLRIHTTGRFPRTPTEMAAGVFPVNTRYPEFNALRYGADPSGATYSTTALRNWIKVQQFAAQSSETLVSIASLAAPYAFLPKGIYKISGGLGNNSQLNQLHIRGEGSVIQADAGVTIIDFIRYQARIEGISFRGGAVHIDIKTNNIDTDQIYIQQCEFHSPSTAGIRSDNNSASTQLTVVECKFWTDLTSAAFMVIASCDWTQVTRCHVRCNQSAMGAIVCSAGLLNLNHCFFIDGVALAYWIYLDGGSLHANDCRFGGEGGGCQQAVIYCATPDVVEMDCCICPGAVTASFAVFATHFPKRFRISNSQFGLPPRRMRLDLSNLPAFTEVARLGGLGTCFEIQNCGTDGDYTAGIEQTSVNPYTYTVARSVAATNSNRYRSGSPTVAEVVLNSPGQTALFTPALTPTNATAATVVVNPGYNSYQVTATANNGSMVIDYTAAMASLPSGATYTMVFDISVDTDNPQVFNFQFHNKVIADQVFAKGRYTVCLPFYFDASTAGRTIGIEVTGMPPGSQWSWLKFRVLQGYWQIQGARTQIEGSAAPVAGSWIVGDRVELPPTAAGNYGAVCVVSGSPGTWKTFGAIAA